MPIITSAISEAEKTAAKKALDTAQKARDAARKKQEDQTHHNMEVRTARAEQNKKKPSVQNPNQKWREQQDSMRESRDSRIDDWHKGKSSEETTMKNMNMTPKQKSAHTTLTGFGYSPTRVSPLGSHNYAHPAGHTVSVDKNGTGIYQNKNDITGSHDVLFRGPNHLKNHLSSVHKPATSSFDMKAIVGTLQAEIAADSWWDRLDRKGKQIYIKAHPHSKYAKQAQKAAPGKDKPAAKSGSSHTTKHTHAAMKGLGFKPSHVSANWGDSGETRTDFQGPVVHHKQMHEALTPLGYVKQKPTKKNLYTNHSWVHPNGHRVSMSTFKNEGSSYQPALYEPKPAGKPAAKPAAKAPAKKGGAKPAAKKPSVPAAGGDLKQLFHQHLRKDPANRERWKKIQQLRAVAKPNPNQQRVLKKLEAERKAARAAAMIAAKKSLGKGGAKPAAKAPAKKPVAKKTARMRARDNDVLGVPNKPAKKSKEGYQLAPGQKKKAFHNGPKDADGKTDTQKWAEKRQAEKLAAQNPAVDMSQPTSGPGKLENEKVKTSIDKKAPAAKKPYLHPAERQRLRSIKETLKKLGKAGKAGSLHEYLKIPHGTKIPADKLIKLARDGDPNDPYVKKARMAASFQKLHWKD